jgi:hypothetical protein
MSFSNPTSALNEAWFKWWVQTEKCGWGLTADEDIKAGAFLVEYVGEGTSLINGTT